MSQDLHHQQTDQILVPQALARGSLKIIDVRSPTEFSSGHIPGSLNIPLLDDQERCLVGTLYKQKGQESALAAGYLVFEAKKQELIAKLGGISRDHSWSVLCARGGMRSRVMSVFLGRLGYQCEQVQGGYKKYRNYCLDQIEHHDYPNLIVLQGKTGVGKTLVLHELGQSIDLEGMANHRGSMFGGVGLAPRSQKNFEGLLVERLNQIDWNKPVFIEGESRKIGPINVPGPLYLAMKRSPTVLLSTRLEVRTQRIINEYILGFPHLSGRIREGVVRLKQDLGQNKVDHLLKKFDQGDYAGCFSVVLLEYYDKKYSHTLKHLKYLIEIDSTDISNAAKLLKDFTERHEKFSF